MSKPMRRAWLLFLTATLVLGAVPAMAQQALLYEVTETMSLRGIRNPRRIATAALMGSVQGGAPICPALLAVPSCSINVIASDDIRSDTGKGWVSGNFDIVVQGDNPFDGPELTVARGTLRGDIDLSPTLVNIPLGSISGRWTVTGLPDGPLATYKSKGTFVGTFRLPFGDAPPSYLSDVFVPFPLAANEFSLGVPTVRLEVTFVD